MPASIEWLLADGANADMTLGTLEDDALALEKDLDDDDDADDAMYHVSPHVGDVLSDSRREGIHTLEGIKNDSITQVRACATGMLVCVSVTEVPALHCNQHASSTRHPRHASLSAKARGDALACLHHRAPLWRQALSPNSGALCLISSCYIKHTLRRTLHFT